MALFDSLDQATRDLIFGALKGGRYSLLLGSGFSRSSRSSDNRPLPSGWELAQELENEFSLPKGKYGLPALAGAIEPIEKRDAFFERRFKNCKASAGASLVPTFVWRNIFLFNIDDVLADAYSNTSALQKPEFITGRQPFSRPEDPADLLVIHLHGYVRRPDDGYVFSTAEYGAAARQDGVWFKIAVDEISLQPFIVLGCSLDEPDIEYYLASRTDIPAKARQVPPSIFVTQSMDSVLRRRCERFGMIPIEAKSDDFLHELSALAGRRPTPLELIRPKGVIAGGMTDLPEREQRIFYRQWTYVRKDELPQENEIAALLTGVEPTWTHIMRSEPVVRADVQQIVQQATSWAESATAKSQVLLLSAASGDGKSTTLLHAAHELSQMNMEVYYFNGKERLNDEAAAATFGAITKPIVISSIPLQTMLSNWQKRQLNCVK